MNYLNPAILLTLFLTFFSQNAFAEYLDRVAVQERPNGSVSITRFSANDMARYGYVDEDDFMEWYMNRIAPGKSYAVISEDDIPKRPDGQWDKSERGKWRLKPDKKGVRVDQTIELPEEARRRILESIKLKLKTGQALNEEEAEALINA